MSSRSKRRRYLRRVIEAAQAALAAVDQPPHQPPPPEPPAAAVSTGAPPPQLWHFQHQYPGVPGIMYCVVQAPNLQEARAAAYLISEQFSQNAIGFLKANAPIHPPKRA